MNASAAAERRLRSTASETDKVSDGYKTPIVSISNSRVLLNSVDNVPTNHPNSKSEASLTSND